MEILNEECFDILSEQNTKKDVKDFDLYLITVEALDDEKLASCDFNEARKITDSNYTGLLYWINAITTPKDLVLKVDYGFSALSQEI